MDGKEFYVYVEKEIGIKITSYKEEQLSRRLESFMKRRGIKDYKEFKELLSTNKTILNEFKEFITINVTEFFRNQDLFNVLEGNIKSELSNKKNIKVWSAATSKGCEAYSIAILLEENLKGTGYSILGTDIDERMLNQGKEGIYSLEEIKNVKNEYLDKYFEKLDDKYMIQKFLKNKVEFKKHDLLLDSYGEDFDLIVCRNVVIYFKNHAKQEVIGKLIKALKKDGLLFVGGTECIYNYAELGLEKISTYIYKKK